MPNILNGNGKPIRGNTFIADVYALGVWAIAKAMGIAIGALWLKIKHMP